MDTFRILCFQDPSANKLHIRDVGPQLRYVVQAIFKELAYKLEKHFSFVIHQKVCLRLKLLYINYCYSLGTFLLE